MSIFHLDSNTDRKLRYPIIEANSQEIGGNILRNVAFWKNVNIATQGPFNVLNGTNLTMDNTKRIRITIMGRTTQTQNSAATFLLNIKNATSSVDWQATKLLNMVTGQDGVEVTGEEMPAGDTQAFWRLTSSVSNGNVFCNLDIEWIDEAIGSNNEKFVTVSAEGMSSGNGGNKNTRTLMLGLHEEGSLNEINLSVPAGITGTNVFIQVYAA